MATALKNASDLDLDNRLLSSLDCFFLDMRTSNMDISMSNWNSIDKDLTDIREAGTLESDTSTLALDISNWMEILCDAFVAFEVKADRRVAEFYDITAAEEKTPPPSPKLSRSSSLAREFSPPSSSSSPAYIQPAYSWLLANLHNPYPSAEIRDSIASSTSCERRLIDAWFVDVRRRIGWTAFLAKERPSIGDRVPPRRQPSTTGSELGEFKYKTRKDLITASGAYFLRRPNANAPLPEDAKAYQLTNLEEMSFSIMEDKAKQLYKDKLEPSELVKAITSEVKQWTPELGDQAKAIRAEERRSKRRKASVAVKVESDTENNYYDELEGGNTNKRLRLSIAPVPISRSGSLSLEDELAEYEKTLASSPSPSPFDSSSSSSPSLKRKRAVSDSYPEQTLISPSTKRLRTALNFSGLSRSVSDPISHVSRPQWAQSELTFSGFPASTLDTWFDHGDLADPFGSNFDPFAGLDPVVRSDEASASPSHNGAAALSVPPVQPYPLYINLTDSSFLSQPQSRSQSPSSSNEHGFFSPASFSSLSPSSSAPATPALSASGSLTDLSGDEDASGDEDIDSLFGDVRAVDVASAEPEAVDSSIGVSFAASAKANSKTPVPGFSPDILSSTMNPTSQLVSVQSLPNFDDPFSLTDLPLPDFDLEGLPDLSDINVHFGLDRQPGLGLQLIGSTGTSEGSVGFSTNGTDFDALLAMLAGPTSTSAVGAT